MDWRSSSAPFWSASYTVSAIFSAPVGGILPLTEGRFCRCLCLSPSSRLLCPVGEASERTRAQPRNGVRDYILRVYPHRRKRICDTQTATSRTHQTSHLFM